MSDKLIALTYARGMGNLPELVENAVGYGRVERVFAKAQLPMGIIDDRDIMIPVRSMVDLFEHAGAAVGDRCFGLRVGLEMGHKAYGMMAAYASQASTLMNALKRLQIALSVHQPEGRFSLSRTQGGWLWGYFKPRCPEVIDRHHADHIIPCFISLAREYLGQDWIPRKVGVPYADDGGGKELRDFLNCDWRFSRKGVLVELPDHALHARRIIKICSASKAPPVLTSCEVFASAVKHREMRFVDRVERLVQLLAMESKVDLHTVAAMTDMPTRSLQRHLHQNGTSFREIVLRAQMRRAAGMVKETDMTLTQIALDLGYHEPGNFTRAFKKYHGRSPSSLRR